ncbi:MAG: VanZ family protein [bacterium]|nr:VanZ family protein [bacterium]
MSRSLFTSDRERRLWLWTLVLMVAIYSTLGLARTVVDALAERNLLRVSFALVLLLVVGPIAWRWVKRRPGRGEIGVALGVAFAYLMVGIRMNNWAERTHLIEYGIVAALIHQALLERVRNGRRVPAPAALAVTVTALLGLLDEAIQAMLPSRFFDVRDVFFNALAGFMVVAARLAIAPQRGPGWRVWFLWLMAGAFGWGEGVYWAWFSSGDPKILQSIPTVISGGYLGVAVGGVLIGVLQWLVLRRHVTRAGRWVFASLGAAAVVGAVVFGVGVVDAEAGWIGGVSVFGTVVGVLQWLVLRRQIPGRAGGCWPARWAGWWECPWGTSSARPGSGPRTGP